MHRLFREPVSLRLVIAVISLGLRPFETLSAARMAGRTVPGTTREIAGEPERSDCQEVEFSQSALRRLQPCLGYPEDFVFAFWREP